ncbi:disease resistance protein (TIR-NBS-LRR class) putative [Euphorbia peplus]|nr:disease resistance protein (TIR-NBS-LRR class) putative [Euphorbia peplus]
MLNYCSSSRGFHIAITNAAALLFPSSATACSSSSSCPAFAKHFKSSFSSSTLSLSSSATLKKHDVFINFRGYDVRSSFLSHLQDALRRNGVDAFVDEQLQSGEAISDSLLQTIEASSISIVIFSQNYAFSPWCLDELVKILRCKQTTGQIVIPIFYDVDPIHLQHLTGSFGKAIAQHTKRFHKSLVQSWGRALKEASNLSGFDSHNFKSDSQLIEEITRRTLEKLNSLFSSDSSDDNDDKLVGINSRVEKVMSLLSNEDVNVVGIWGAGGIGKTTIARTTFDRVWSQFEAQCFVENVREKSERGADMLQNEILPNLLGKESLMDVSSFIKKRLSRKKVVVVLDDVSDYGQIKSIIEKGIYCGSGSRLIVTSRDKHLLEYMGAEVYEVEKLNVCEAHVLFNMHAFRQKIPDEGYAELSRRAVGYAQGLPLALEVLGSNLYRRNVEEWKDELEKLKGSSDKKIQKLLRISYDSLSDIEKELFLDIACFFNLRCRDDVERILDVRGSKIGINCLVEKALISISSRNCLNMHGLIEQMAKDIICEEKALQRHSRQWNPEEIYILLTKEMGNEATKGISLNMSKIKNVYLSPKAFQRMYNLRYLNFYDSSTSSCNTNIQVHLPQGLEYLPEQLSQLEELWNGVQNLANLKLIDLSYSEKLIKISDLSGASNLEALYFYGCTSLVEITSSFECLSKLTTLSLEGCSSLNILPSCFHGLLSLKTLSMERCSMLENLPDDICNLKSLSRLNIAYCKNLCGLPQNLGNLESLEHFEVRVSGIKELPDSICNLTSLSYLDVSACVNLSGLPRNFGNLGSLEILYAYGSGIKELPDSICNLKKLRILDVSECVNLHGLPQNLGNLESLKLFVARGSNIEELPVSICNMGACTTLDLGECFNLHRLPHNLGNLESLEELLGDGSGIKEVPSSINNLRELEALDFSKCQGLILRPLTGDFPHLLLINLNDCGILEFPLGLCSVTSLQHLYLRGNNFESIPESIKQLLMLEELDLGDCKKLKYIPECIQHLSMLRVLNISECTSLDQDRHIKMMDHLLWANVEKKRPLIGLCFQGSEVPEKMIYQNKKGYSLSFSFKLLEQNPYLRCYGCAVLDPFAGKFYDGQVIVDCIGHCVDESGQHCSRLEVFSVSPLFSGIVIQSKHVLLQDFIFQSHDFVKGGKYTAFFQFSAKKPQDKRHCSRDAIIKCGVHPVFEHELVD